MNVFNQTDPKLEIIKICLKNNFLQKIDEGLEWVITSGQLGVELWAAEVVIELREEGHQIQMGLLLPYANYGEKWNEQNKHLLEKVKQKADFVENSSSREYFSPKQFQANQDFVLRNTGGALLMYDPEFEGKPGFLWKSIKKLQDTRAYSCELITFDTLEETAREEEEKRRDFF